jgi:hypothetical protein
LSFQLKYNNVKAKLVARRGRKATGLSEIAGLPKYNCNSSVLSSSLLTEKVRLSEEEGE